jgi:phosphatidate cytidylyltransferase
VEELKKRVLAAIFLAPLIAFLFYFLPHKWFFVFLSLVSLIAMFELVVMADIRESYLVLFLAMISLIPLYQKSLNTYLLWILFSPVIFMFIKFLRGEGRYENINRDTIRGINTMLLCEVFILLPIFYLYLLKEIGRYFPLILLLALWASDTCAYFLGSTFGKRLLVPRISPHKTYEGLFGAIMGSTIVIMLSSKLLGMGILESLIIGVAIGILAQMGDIFESIGKRVCEVKDSSILIPGHGGILDRIDSFIFTTPFLYHYLSGIKG